MSKKVWRGWGLVRPYARAWRAWLTGNKKFCKAMKSKKDRMVYLELREIPAPKGQDLP